MFIIVGISNDEGHNKKRKSYVSLAKEAPERQSAMNCRPSHLIQWNIGNKHTANAMFLFECLDPLFTGAIRPSTNYVPKTVEFVMENSLKFSLDAG